jgi:uncharacterized protein (TIGR00369 family)
MSIRVLTNAGWGFESNCFVCEPANADGLRIPFSHDEDAGIVFASFVLDDRFSGAPSYVHGGVTLAILDEAVAWAAIAIGGKFAVTHTTNTVFDRPVKLGVSYRVEARVVEQTAERIIADAEVLDERGKRRAATHAELVVLGAAQAADAIGEPVDDALDEYLR